MSGACDTIERTKRLFCRRPSRVLVSACSLVGVGMACREQQATSLFLVALPSFLPSVLPLMSLTAHLFFLVCVCVCVFFLCLLVLFSISFSSFVGG